MLQLIFGLLLLWFAGDLLIRSSVRLAGAFNVSKLFVGLTITAIGTSMPELILSVMAVMKSHQDIIVGNVIGSNIANIALGVGIAGTFQLIGVKKARLAAVDLTIFGVSTLILFAFSILGYVSPVAGAVMLSLFVLYFIFKYKNDSLELEEISNKKVTVLRDYLYILWFIVSIVLMYFGAALTIKGAVIIAKQFNISEMAIALITIAFGTSLPEIAVVVVGIIRKETHIVLGGMIGSNICNVLLILGITSLIKPINYNMSFFSVSLLYLFVLTLSIFFTERVKKYRFIYILFIISYFIYAYLTMR